MQLMATDLELSVLSASNIGRQVFAYDAFGWCVSEHALACFKGIFSEPGSRFYLAGGGYRAYLSSIRHWASPDRLSPFARGGLNAYSYVNADPVNYVDPNGEAAFRVLDVLGKVVRTSSPKKIVKHKLIRIQPFGKREVLKQSQGLRAHTPVLPVTQQAQRSLNTLEVQITPQIDGHIRTIAPPATGLMQRRLGQNAARLRIRFRRGAVDHAEEENMQNRIPS